jgi:hypothetical protein
LLTQPTTPPTKKATATTAVITPELRTGKTNANIPNTNISTPSNRVKAFKEAVTILREGLAIASSC